MCVASLGTSEVRIQMATANETRNDSVLSNPQTAVALLVGAVLAVVGIAAPVVAGQSGEFVVFGRNYLHDAIHLLSGVAGLLAGYYAGGRFAKQYNVVLGVTYAFVTVLGFVLADLMAELLAINTADNFLHLALALVFLAVGFGIGSGRN